MKPSELHPTFNEFPRLQTTKWALHPEDHEQTPAEKKHLERDAPPIAAAKTTTANAPQKHSRVQKGPTVVVFPRS